MKIKLGIILSLMFLMTSAWVSSNPDWGFFGHRRINRLAVFTLEPELGQFYKKNIDYITEHAVDPDKRRYATKHEAVRHYIDIDHWGTLPFDDLPKNKDAAVLLHGNMWLITNDFDTIPVEKTPKIEGERDHQFISGANFAFKDSLIFPYRMHLSQQYYKDEKIVSGEDLIDFFESIDIQEFSHLVFEDEFSSYGILPYHLEEYYGQLVKAFATENVVKVLRISAEMGHYIGDACVPLHTTENYNGQLTDQNGIHAFWESRIPELFSDQEFDILSGRARYIVDPKEYFWRIIFESHALCEEVLTIEKNLSQEYPDDQQYCYVERLERTIRTECEDYARTYHNTMNGMVEDRWHRAIVAIGSVWYSAWLDAGSPDLSGKLAIESLESKKKLEDQYRNGTPKGRVHENF